MNYCFWSHQIQYHISDSMEGRELNLISLSYTLFSIFFFYNPGLLSCSTYLMHSIIPFSNCKEEGVTLTCQFAGFPFLLLFHSLPPFKKYKTDLKKMIRSRNLYSYFLRPCFCHHVNSLDRDSLENF